MALIAICSGALCALPVMAQDQDAAPARHGGRMGGEGRGLKQLNLSSDQESQVKAINEDSRKQMEALRSDTSLSQADRRSKMMEIHKTSQDKIGGVLTDEQKTKYDAMQAQMREKMKERRGGGTDGAAPQQQ